MTYLRDDLKEDEQQAASNVLGPDGQPQEGSTTPEEGFGAGDSGAITSQAPSNAQGNFRPSEAGASRQVNVSQYIDKNKPQAQKIANKAESGITSKASEIGKQSLARKSALSNVIAQNQAQLQTESDNAVSLINKVNQTTPGGLQMTQASGMGSNLTGGLAQGGPATGPQTYAPTQEEQSAFSNISNKKSDLIEVPTLDLSQQQLAATRLGQSTTSIPSILQDTFAKPDRQYTSGQQRLDQLLLGGTGAGSQLKTAAQGASKQALTAIAGYKQQALGEIAGQGDFQQTQADLVEKARADALSGIMGTASSDGVDATGIQARLEAEQAQRAALLPQLEQSKEYQDRVNFLKSLYSKGNNSEFLSSVLDPSASQTLASKNWRQNLADMGTDLSGINSIEDLRAKAALTSRDTDLLGLDTGTNSFLQDYGKGQDYSSIRSGYDNLSSKLGSYNISDEIEKSLQAQGTTSDQLAQGGDLNVANLASKEEIARYNALQGLAGSQDIIAPESKQDYLSAEELQQILARYK